MSELPNFELEDLKKFNLNVFTDLTYTKRSTVSVMIALATAYNDMKDIFWFYQILVDAKPQDLDAITPEAGQFNGMKKLALEQSAELSDKENSIYNCLLKIRNNVGFHYYGTKSFGIGFDQYVKEKGDKAGIYASLGTSAQATRFYFADAATQFAIGKLLTDNEVSFEELIAFIKLMNQSLRYLLESFLDSQNSILNGSRDERRPLRNQRGYKD